MAQPRKIFQNGYKLKRKKFLDYINGRTFPGHKLPKESELAKILEMSLGTVREILRELEMSGTVTKMKGQGNFLNTSTQNMKMRIDVLKDFSELIEDKGYEVNFKTSVFEGETDERLTKLGEEFFPEMMSGKEYRVISNTYYADSTPAILAVFLVPSEFSSEDISDEDFVHSYWEDYIQSFDHAGIKLEVGVVDQMLSEYLELPVGKPIQMWSEVNYNRFDELLCCSYCYFNPEIMEMTMVRK